MASDAEQQAEEIEVLLSIYGGDANFKQINNTTYQYKFLEEDKTFILEIKWGPTYPTEKPEYSLDIFYNQHLTPTMRAKILELVDAAAEQGVGCASTFTLIECLRDKFVDIMTEQTEEAAVAKLEKLSIAEKTGAIKKPEKKGQLTKAQKRRKWDRAESGRSGEKPRGSDWVDVVKHLSQAPHKPAT